MNKYITALWIITGTQITFLSLALFGPNPFWVTLVFYGITIAFFAILIEVHPGNDSVDDGVWPALVSFIAFIVACYKIMNILWTAEYAFLPTVGGRTLAVFVGLCICAASLFVGFFALKAYKTLKKVMQT